MTELPPLPEPPCTVPFCQGNDMGYTADQMRAYAQAAVLAEREACADICEDTSQEYEQYTGQERPLNMSCAAAIRSRGE